MPSLQLVYSIPLPHCVLIDHSMAEIWTFHIIQDSSQATVVPPPLIIKALETVGGTGKRTAIDQPLEIVGSGLMLTLKYLHIGEAQVSDRAWKLGSKDKNESLC